MAKRQKPTQACKQLTPRQALFVKSLASGGTITQAARNAGYSGKNLAQSGHQVLKTIQSKMPEVMDEAGLGARELIEKYLVPLLHATTTKFFSYKGRITDWVTVPDNHTRLMAVDMVLRLWGAYGQASRPAHLILA